MVIGSISNRRSPPAFSGSAIASMKSRSRTTRVAARKGRSSPGLTAPGRSAPCSACGSPRGIGSLALRTRTTPDGSGSLPSSRVSRNCPVIELPSLRSRFWLARDGDERKAQWQLDPVQNREGRDQPIEQARAAQPPQSEQPDIDQPSERAHRVASPDPLDDEAARLEFAAQLALGVPAVMTDIAVEGAEERRVARHQHSEAPAWLEQRVDGLHGGLVVSDVLEDVDTERRVETVTPQRLDRLGQVMAANDDVGAVPIPFGG